MHMYTASGSIRLLQALIFAGTKLYCEFEKKGVPVHLACSIY